MNRTERYTRQAFETLRTWLIAPDLSPETINEMRKEVDFALSVMSTYGQPTATEFHKVIGGSNWVVARRTKRITERYGEDVICLSQQSLARAEEQALQNRKASI